MFGNDRTELRRMFVQSWRKKTSGQPLEPLEELIASIIAMHPEYHNFMTDEKALDNDYLPEMGQSNPFLHLGLHIGIREQISTDRPAGITSLYQQMVTNCGDEHEAEHQILECLAEILWDSQRHNTLPDEGKYLELVRQRVGKFK